MEFLEKLSLAGLVPVIAVNDADDAVPLCKALSDGGLPVAEITFRTAAAEEAIRRVKPVMLTAVHCETPSGTLNPIGLLGKLKKDLGVPLFYVDTVAGLGGAPVHMDEWNVDLMLGGSQKCLSCPPSMSMVGVSAAAWERMKEVNYQGYDAILPFRTVRTDGRCPYTPNWHGV